MDWNVVIFLQRTFFAYFFISAQTWATGLPPATIAAQQQIPFCLRKLHAITEDLAIKGNHPPKKVTKLARRITNASLKAMTKHFRRGDFKIYHGFASRIEMLVKSDLKDHGGFHGVETDILVDIQKDLDATGGEARVNGAEFNHLRFDGTRPILSLTFQAPSHIVAHEGTHLKHFREIRDEERAKRFSKRKADREAVLSYAQPRIRETLENRAKAVELGLMARRFEQLLASEAATLPFRTPSGSLDLPLEVFVQPADLIHHAAYPLSEHLQILAEYQAAIDSPRIRWTSFRSSRKAEQARVKEEIDESVKKMVTVAIDLRDELISELKELENQTRKSGQIDVAEKHREARAELEEKSVAELIRGDGKTEDSIHLFEPPLSEKIRIEEARRDRRTRISPRQKEEIQRTLTRTYDNSGNSRNSWGYWGGVQKEFPHQGRQIPADALEQLDARSLDFSFESAISKNRIASYVVAPVTNPKEIRRRQQAVRELHPEGAIHWKLLEVYQDTEALGATFRKARPRFEDAFTDWSPRYHYKEIFENRIRIFNREQNRHDRHVLIHEMNRVRGFIDEIQSIRKSLQNAASPRLKQLKWILDSAFSDHHPFGIAGLIRTIRDPDDIVASIEAYNIFRDKKPREMALLEEAMGEIAMMYDIASHAHRKNWTTYPKIRDRNPDVGPVIKVVEAHNPREFAKNKKTSVPNSMELGGRAGNHVLLTGPNAEGKSTFPRTIGLKGILAQLGSPVAAKEMETTPVSYSVYVHPKDSPKDDMSLFMAEGKVLWKKVLEEAKKDPFTLSLLDEIIPGTISVIREDVETEFLIELASHGGLSMTATHNWGTTSLGSDGLSTPVIPPNKSGGQGERSDQFRNFHVNKYNIVPGAANDMRAMYDGAITALRKVGWPEPILERIRKRGEERIRNSEATD